MKINGGNDSCMSVAVQNNLEINNSKAGKLYSLCQGLITFAKIYFGYPYGLTPSATTGDK
jgi:hypothetical protein